MAEFSHGSSSALTITMDVPNLCPCPKCGCGLNDTRSSIIESFQAGAQHPQLARMDALLSSNIAPNEPELEAMAGFMAGPLESMSKIETQIRHLNGVAGKLRATTTGLQAIIADCRAVAHPIRRVPAEFLAEVFMILVESDFAKHLPKFSAVPASDNDPGPPSEPHLAKSPAWTLSRVSSAWRRLAQSTPRLWSYIRLGYTGPSKASSYGYIPNRPERGQPTFLCLTQNIRFSAEHALSISLCYHPYNPTMQLLFALSGRWKEFHAAALSSQGLEGFLNLRLLQRFSCPIVTSTPIMKGGAPNITFLGTILSALTVQGSAVQVPRESLLEFVDLSTDPREYTNDGDTLRFLGEQTGLRKCYITVVDTD